MNMDTRDLALINLTDTNPEPSIIQMVDNVFTDEQIRFLINSVELNKFRYDKARVGHVENDGFVPRIRRSQVAWLDAGDSSVNFYFQKIIETYISVNQQKYRYSLTGIENTQFTKYVSEDESFYDWHVDEEMTGFKQRPMRKLSSVFFLSDPGDYEGGELQICVNPNHIINVEPVKGRMVFFPSSTIHKVNPVTGGVRYTAVNWARGPAYV